MHWTAWVTVLERLVIYLYSLATFSDVTLSLLPTHFRVVFKVFHKTHCQTHSEKTRSLFQQALPCPLLQRIHKPWVPPTRITLPHCGLYVLVFAMRFFTTFSYVYNPVFYRYQAAWGVVTQNSSKNRLPGRDIPPKTRSGLYTQQCTHLKSQNDTYEKEDNHNQTCRVHRHNLFLVGEIVGLWKQKQAKHCESISEVM